MEHFTTMKKIFCNFPVFGCQKTEEIFKAVTARCECWFIKVAASWSGLQASVLDYLLLLVMGLETVGEGGKAPSQVISWGHQGRSRCRMSPKGLVLPGRAGVEVLGHWENISSFFLTCWYEGHSWLCHASLTLPSTPHGSSLKAGVHSSRTLIANNPLLSLMTCVCEGHKSEHSKQERDWEKCLLWVLK